MLALHSGFRAMPRLVGRLGPEGAKSAQGMLRSADEILAIATDGGFPMYFGYGSFIRGWCLGALGQAADGIPLSLEGLANFRASGCNLVVPFFLTTLAEIYGMAAQADEGLKRVAEAANIVEATQERWADAEMHRLRGTLSLFMHQRAAAEDSFHQALAVARRQSAKFWELRAAMSMARLWRDQGKRDEARELLAPIYGWFTEGFDTLDLKEAKELLDELSSDRVIYKEISDWLDKLGMSEYAQRFAENRIDLSVLPDLTDQHLKDLGVALGDRLKMLRPLGSLPALLRPHLSSPQLPNRRSKTLPSAAKSR